MKKFIFIMLFILTVASVSKAFDRKKGDSFNNAFTFRKEIGSEYDRLEIEDKILLDFTEKNSLIYTATQNRSQAVSRETELSDVSDYYVGWTLNFCDQIRTVTAYTASKDGDDVVIGRFTLDSAYTAEPPTGANIRLINPAGVIDQTQSIVKFNPSGYAQIGGDYGVAIVTSEEGKFFLYSVSEEESSFYVDILKPVKDSTINVSKFCMPFSAFGAFQDAWITYIGIYLDDVPADTKVRMYFETDDMQNPRYPIMENVTIDDFERGLGGSLIESTYADIQTWNNQDMSDPTLSRVDTNAVIVIEFSDVNGDPVFVPIPMDTSVTDYGSFRTVRSNNIQSASGKYITLDANADPSDDAYNGVRFYDDNSDKRDIVDYVGATRVAELDSALTIEPSPGDPYDLKIGFQRMMTVYGYKETTKKQVQTKHNIRYYTYADDGAELEMGTINYVDTTGGAITLIAPIQQGQSEGGWIKIIDAESNFDVNSVTVDFHSQDNWEGGSSTDYVCDQKDVVYDFRHLNISYGWTVDLSNVFTLGEMYQFDQSNTIDIDAKDTWYEITGFTEGETNNIIFQNGKEFKILVAGWYALEYGICFTDGVITMYKFRLAINGTTQGKTQTCGRRTNAADMVPTGRGGIFYLEVDDIVTLEVLNATNTSDIDIINANVKITKIEGN